MKPALVQSQSTVFEGFYQADWHCVTVGDKLLFGRGIRLNLQSRKFMESLKTSWMYFGYSGWNSADERAAGHTLITNEVLSGGTDFSSFPLVSLLLRDFGDTVFKMSSYFPSMSRRSSSSNQMQHKINLTPNYQLNQLNEANITSAHIGWGLCTDVSDCVNVNKIFFGSGTKLNVYFSKLNSFNSLVTIRLKSLTRFQINFSYVLRFSINIQTQDTEASYDFNVWFSHNRLI